MNEWVIKSIEIEENYCKIAVERLAQGVLDLKK